MCIYVAVRHLGKRIGRRWRRRRKSTRKEKERGGERRKLGGKDGNGGTKAVCFILSHTVRVEKVVGIQGVNYFSIKQRLCAPHIPVITDLHRMPPPSSPGQGGWEEERGG